jgi:S1 RNA binding domain protein
MLVEVGSVVEGKVTGITSFGAFIQLPEGKTGLVHISEIAEEYVKDIKSHLSENQNVKVKVISIDNEGKIGLSIKKAREKTNVVKSSKPIEIDWGKSAAENLSFEEQLSKFKKDSEERMRDLKKNVDSKRGGGGYRKMSYY